MLLAMLGNWAVIGTPIYPSMEAGQTIAYVVVLSSLAHAVHFDADQGR